jgi:hypothetical protein
MGTVGTIFGTKENSMKWFKRMIVRWAQEDWNSDRQEKYGLSRPSTINAVRSNSDNIDSHTGLNITVMPAIGGKIITFRHYDRRKDDNQYRHYVIPDDMDFERELGKMITLESIRQG